MTTRTQTIDGGGSDDNDDNDDDDDDDNGNGDDNDDRNHCRHCRRHHLGRQEVEMCRPLSFCLKLSLFASRCLCSLSPMLFSCDNKKNSGEASLFPRQEREGSWRWSEEEVVAVIIVIITEARLSLGGSKLSYFPFFSASKTFTYNSFTFSLLPLRKRRK